MRIVVLFLFFLIVSHLSFSQESERRMALVIGNSEYENINSLRNPANDAKDISTALKELGFEVSSIINGTRKQMFTAIRKFGQELSRYDVGLFYYAGHGVQFEGRNYLITIDADIRKEEDIPFESIELARVLAEMESAGSRVNIVILDACRNNPYTSRYRSLNRGLSVVEAPVGSLIVYATPPGDVAEDGPGRNGILTAALLKHIKNPGVDIEIMLKDVRRDVQATTEGKQVPWTNSSLTGRFYFAPGRQEYHVQEAFLTIYPDEDYAPPIKIEISESREGPFKALGEGYGREFPLPSGFLWVRAIDQATRQHAWFQYQYKNDYQYELYPRFPIPSSYASRIDGFISIPSKPQMLPENRAEKMMVYKISGEKYKGLDWYYYPLGSAMIFGLTFFIGTSIMPEDSRDMSVGAYTSVGTVIGGLFGFIPAAIEYSATEIREIKVPIPENIVKNRQIINEWSQQVSKIQQLNFELLQKKNEEISKWSLKCEEEQINELIEVIHQTN